MTKFLYLTLVVAVVAMASAVVTSCREAEAVRLDRAEALVAERPDSAAILLSDIDYFTLDDDARAKYIVTKAQADLLSRHSLVTDSLLPVAVNHYKETADTMRWLKANIAYLHYLIEMDRSREAVGILDEVIAAIPPDSIDWQYELRTLRMHTAMTSTLYPQAIAEAEWLMYHTVFPRVKFQQAYYRLGLLFLAGRKQEAKEWGDSVLRSD